MKSYEKSKIYIKPSSDLIGRSDRRRGDHVLVVLDSRTFPKGELDEDYKNFINDADLDCGGMSYREARDARLRSMNEIRSSGMEMRGDCIEDQERVRSEKNLKQDERIRGRLRWIGIITPMMNKSLMKTIILCGNVEDFLEIDQTSSDFNSNLLYKGELDEDYRNFVNDADLEFGGLSDPKARDEKLEIPKKLCSNEPDLRQSSMKLEPRESKTEGQRVLRKGFLDENERIDIKEMLNEPNGFLRKGD